MSAAYKPCVPGCVCADHTRERAVRSARRLLCMLPPRSLELAGLSGLEMSSVLFFSPVLRPACRPHTLNSTSTSKSFQSTVTGELNAPYSKQFVHSKSSQYRRMKTEWKSNVYLARSRIQVGKTSRERRAGGIWHSGEERPVCEKGCTRLWERACFLGHSRPYGL